MRTVVCNIIPAVVMLWLLGSLGCVRESESVAQWPGVSAECSRLFKRLESDFAMENDSTAIITEIDSIRAIAGKSDDRRLQSLADYWEGRRLERLGRIPEARRMLEKALSKNDSLRWNYDFRRIHLILDRLDGTRPIDRYLRLVDDERFFRNCGDLHCRASVAQQLGNLFITTLRYPDALRYLLECDSLLEEAGLEDYRRKNRINIAMAYHHCCDSVRADSTLRPLLDAPSIIGDSPVYHTVLRNMYVITGRREYILHAFGILSDKSSGDGTSATYAAILADAYQRASMRDSADYYSSLAFARLHEIRDYNSRGMALRCYAATLRERGDMADSLVRVQEMLLLTLDSLYSYRQTTELERLENKREIEMAAVASESRRQQLRNRAVMVISIIVVAAIGVIALMMRRNSRHKLRHMELQLQTERDRRRLLSLAMMVEEKDGFIAGLHKEITRMKEENPGNGMARLEALLKANESDRITREYFFESFEKLNPAFIPNLKHRCPDLTESLLQLACLIVTGIDNRRISEILNIRAASVNQARWRLRSRLGIAKDASLEEELRRMV